MVYVKQMLITKKYIRTTASYLMFGEFPSFS